MTQEPVELDFGGIKLRGNLYLPDRSDIQQAALFLHGWTGRANTHAAEFLARNGIAALTISLPGHNNSEGDIHTLTRAEALEASMLAYDFLASKIPTEANIAAVGNSFGGYIAAILSAKRPFNGLSLRVPANYPDDGMDKPQYGKGNDDPEVANWRRQVQGPGATESLRNIRNFGGKLQLIEAENDDRIPHEVVESYLNAVPDKTLLEYHFMQGWPHSLGDDSERNKAFQTILLSWLNAL